MLNGKTVLTGATILLALQPAHAATDRPEKVVPTALFVSDTCPIVPDAAVSDEFTSGKESALLAGMLAVAAGEVVKVGLNAAGDALEKASREQGFVAEGTGKARLLRLKAQEAPGKGVSRLEPIDRCLVLYRDDPEGPAIDGIGGEKGLVALDGRDGVKLPLANIAAALKQRRISTIPSLYVEARLINLREGIVIRPVLIWYRKPLPGAPRDKPSEAELHLTLATPSAADIGTAFGTARMVLPKTKPGTMHDWTQLEQSTSSFMPKRPTEGYVDSQRTKMDAAYAAVATRKAERTATQRADKAAKLKAGAPKATAEAKAAAVVAADALSDSEAALTAAETTISKFPASVDVGATNVKLRFVVVRQANKFGLAVAAALKGQAEAAGKAVAAELQPTPEWAAADTTYVTAEAALAAKQRDFDAATLAGEAAKAAQAYDDIRVAKAKLNEAVNRRPKRTPYRRAKGTPFVEQRDGYDGRFVRAGCGVGRA